MKPVPPASVAAWRRCHYVIPREVCALFSAWLAREDIHGVVHVERGKVMLSLFTDDPYHWPPLAQCNTPAWAARGWTPQPGMDPYLPVWVHRERRAVLEADDTNVHLILCRSERVLQAELCEVSPRPRSVGARLNTK